MSGSRIPFDDAWPIDGLVCFCHLRWSFVWQRPQHILTRLATRTDVIVVEEPEIAEGETLARLTSRETDGLTILTPIIPADSRSGWGFNAANNAVVADLLESYLQDVGWGLPGRRHAVWHYTPMALGTFPPSIPVDVTVYDVMDELANFRGAPADLKFREQALFNEADLVFTGGPSLFHAREGKHPRLSLFASGVESSHFAAARTIDALPTDVATLPRPIIGFYGVLDERLDVRLLGEAALRQPKWSFVLIGPIVKIDPATLPTSDNLHFLGIRSYAELPAYLASFDVAMLPFAINEATRFISPTKTLEYLAGGAPVVSTPIVDVIELYGDVVEIAGDVDEFIAAIAGRLSEQPEQRAARHEVAAKILSRYEWDAIVDRMASQIEAALDEAPLLPKLPRDRSSRLLAAAPAD